MAQLHGHKQIFHSDTSIVDTSQISALGSRGVDANGNEYIYLQGVGSTVAGDWVVFDENYATTRLVAGEVGAIAIAMAAINATTSYGWYQIFGVNTIARTDTIAADSALYIDGTTGRVDDLGVAGDLILGAYSMTADSSNVATVFLIYPHVSNALGGEGTEVDSESPSGAIDGSNVTFTLANTPISGSVKLYLNGARQNVGAANDYTISGATITYNTAPLTNSVLLCDYRT